MTCDDTYASTIKKNSRWIRAVGGKKHARLASQVFEDSAALSETHTINDRLRYMRSMSAWRMSAIGEP